jgi:mannosyltransferase
MVSSEARSTALVSTLAIALTISFLKAIDSQNRKLEWFRFAALLAVSLYVFIFSALIVICLGLYLVINRREQIVTFGLAAISAFTLALPIFILAYQERAQVAWITKAQPLIYAYQTIISVPYMHSPVFAITMCLVAYAIYKKAHPLIIFSAFAPGFTLMLLTYAITPVFVDRYLVLTTPAISILTGFGIASLPWFKASVALKRQIALSTVTGVVLVVLALPAYVNR